MNDDQGSANIVRVLGQLLMLPFAAFVYGMEMLIKTMQGIQQVSNQGMEVMAGPRNQFNGLPEVRAAPTVPMEPISDINSHDAFSGKTEKTYEKEEKLLSTDGNSGSGPDKDLHDDMLKLIRYKILFVKREYEVAFPEREDLVSENMDGSAFAAWKVAEFIQQLADGKTEVPPKWGTKYPSPQGTYVSNGMLKKFPDEDKKYLRVYYEVLDRYPREKFKYEEQQIKVLEDIRDELKKPSPGPQP